MTAVLSAQPLDPHLIAILARVSGFTAGWRRDAFAREVVDALQGEGWEIVRRAETPRPQAGDVPAEYHHHHEEQTP